MEWKTMDIKGGRTRLGGKIGEILEGDDFICSLCSGTGILPRSKGIKCPVCRGAGMVSLTGPAVVCAYCKGRGEYPPRTNITCTVCRGKGLVASKSLLRYVLIAGEPVLSQVISCLV